ncbi:IS982 family transposase [Candidatus Parcubacteria bacterium]|nr:IS982 family transposase [Candidatus Parcubacteria bacterium]
MTLLQQTKQISKKENFSEKIFKNLKDLLLIIYCFCKDFITEIKENVIKKLPLQKIDRNHPPIKKGKLSVAEITTLAIFRNFTGHKNWADFYRHIVNYHTDDFPNFPNYKNFVKMTNKVAIFGKEILDFFMKFFIQKTPEKDCKITDSTKLKVCENKRIFHHKTADGFAQRGKSSMGWFFGFKLHIICNEKMEILKIKFTPGNTDDRKGLMQIWDDIFGMIIADAGYIGKNIFTKAKEKGIHLFTCVKANMKKLLTKEQKEILNKRSLVETVFSVLKLRMNLETTLPRSVDGYFSHYVWVLVGYQFKKFLKNIDFKPLSA